MTQRIIKFRAWDTRINEMEEFDLNSIYWRGEETGDYDFPDSCVTVMQFTGLLDKNGKEGFEKDIVEFEEPEFETEMVKGIIEFEDGCFRAKTKDGNYLLFTITDFEIIGNIMENPELLEEKIK